MFLWIRFSSLLFWFILIVVIVPQSIQGVPIEPGHNSDLQVQVADNLDSLPSNIDDWVEIGKVRLKNTTSTLELELNVHVALSGLLGSLVDWFSPPEFDIAVTDKSRGCVFFSGTYQSNEEAISATLDAQKECSSTIHSLLILFRNRNLIFKSVPQVAGELISGDDVFDLRKTAAQCPFPVYMQGLCGACYADVVAGAGTDAVCLSGLVKFSAKRDEPRTPNNVPVKLSPQPLVSCANLGGCSGGSPYLAARWTEQNGLVETELCPFESGTCEPEKDVEKNGCVACSPAMEGLVSPAPPSYRFRPMVLPSLSESAMRGHIESGGSVMVIFEAHANFQIFFARNPFSVYGSTEETPSLGNHAVRLVGFGVDDADTRFWIALNSWGGSWGDKGAFKIARGDNLCDIEKWPVGLVYLAEDSGIAGIPSRDDVNAQDTLQEHLNKHPNVGGWKEQDLRLPYWKSELDNWKANIAHALGNDQNYSVNALQSKVGHGYWVKLRVEQEAAGEKTVMGRVFPNGTVEFNLVKDVRSNVALMPQHVIANSVV